MRMEYLIKINKNVVKYEDCKREKHFFTANTFLLILRFMEHKFIARCDDVILFAKKFAFRTARAQVFFFCF